MLSTHHAARTTAGNNATRVLRGYLKHLQVLTGRRVRDITSPSCWRRRALILDSRQNYPKIARISQYQGKWSDNQWLGEQYASRRITRTLLLKDKNMSELNDELLTNQLIDAAFTICQEQGIRLTDQAARFLRLAAEALVKDPPRSTNPSFSVESWLDLGREILTQALRDQHIIQDMEVHGRVSFPTLVYVLSDITHRYLTSMGFKS